MNEVDFRYHHDNLKELDVDQLVYDLGLTTEEIMAAFPHHVTNFIVREFG